MGQRGDAARLEELGCSGYLLKPVKQSLLREALVTVLGQKQVGDGAVHLVTRHFLSEQKRQGMRILLAEDNPVNQKLAVVLLQKAGFSVDVVDNGLQAVGEGQGRQVQCGLDGCADARDGWAGGNHAHPPGG